jgi:hypothetical protein
MAPSIFCTPDGKSALSERECTTDIKSEGSSVKEESPPPGIRSETSRLRWYPSKLDAFALLKWRTVILHWMCRIFAGAYLFDAVFGLWVALTGKCYSEFECSRVAVSGTLLMLLSLTLKVFGLPKVHLLKSTPVTVFTYIATLTLFGGGLLMAVNAWWYARDQIENNAYFGPTIGEHFLFMCTAVTLGMTDFILSYQSEQKQKRLEKRARSLSLSLGSPQNALSF